MGNCTFDRSNNSGNIYKGVEKMGNITELSKGNYEGLKKQVCECIENAYNAGLKKGLENLKNTRPEETENYKLGYKLGYEKGERHKTELWETALNEAKAESYKLGYDTAKQEVQEKTEKEIKVGDEIQFDNKAKGVVISINEKWYRIVNENGFVNSWKRNDFKKTGRNFSAEVSQLLDRLKGDK